MREANHRLACMVAGCENHSNEGNGVLYTYLGTTRAGKPLPKPAKNEKHSVWICTPCWSALKWPSIDFGPNTVTRNVMRRAVRKMQAGVLE